MSNVTDLMDGLVAGTKTLDEVAADFAARQWPVEEKSPQTYDELAAADEADPPIPPDGSFAEVEGYFVDGKIDADQYTTLGEAAVKAMSGQTPDTSGDISPATGDLFSTTEESAPTPPASPPAEASAAPEGKAAKPPEISTGSFVSWGSNRGRVDMVVTNGKVPGIDDDVEGTASSPAARVVIYEADGSGYKPTSRKVGAKVNNLKRTAPLRANGAKSADGVLVDLMAEHEERGLDAQPGARAVKAVFERGIGAWPGAEATTLDAEEWGLARVKTFLTMASEGKSAAGYVHDIDLLPETNPARRTMEGKSVDPGVEEPVEVEAEDGETKTIRLDPADVKAALEGLEATSD